MNEDDARAWLSQRFSPTSVRKLERYVDILLAENERQNLIARSTFDQVWVRHIVDSAQLVELVPAVGLWLDVGSGGGLPGIVIATLRNEAIILCEPRRRRAEFLARVVTDLGLANVEVFLGNAQKLRDFSAAIVSARAVASITDLLCWIESCVSRETQFLLPRGRSWSRDMEIARNSWHGRFQVKQSITDLEAGIIVAKGVARR